MTHLLKWANAFTLSMLFMSCATPLVAMQKNSPDYSKLNSSVFGSRSVWGYPHGEPLGTNVTPAEYAAAQKKLQTRAVVGATVTTVVLAWPKLKHVFKR